MSESPWRKSTYSGGANSTCVEVAAAPAVLVRDTADRSGPVLRISAAAWSSFLTILR
jgi:hypothetical protein